MIFYDELLRNTEAERDALLATPIIRQALAGRVARVQYLAFLAQAYHHVKHTVPLLMACGSRLPERLEWLRTATAQYIDEELNHDEWILNDIAAAAGNAEEVRASQPAPATELMVAYAYDTVHRGNPVGFFGMVLVLEGTSVALASRAAAVLQQALALPPQAFTYLTSHGSLDTGHTRFFAQLMNRLEEARDRGAVLHCARMMYRLYGDVFRALPPGEMPGGAA